jgi:hypothetical protein
MLKYNLEVKPGSKQITLRLLISNQGSTDRSFTFRSSQEVDFVIEHQGKPVWRWSEERAFTMAIHDKKISKGRTVTPYEVAWHKQDSLGNPLKPGRYVIKAYFLGEDKQPEGGNTREAGEKFPVASQEISLG